MTRKVIATTRGTSACRQHSWCVNLGAAAVSPSATWRSVPGFPSRPWPTSNAPPTIRAGALNRLVGAADYQLFVLPTRAHSAADWADVIYQELQSGRRSEEVAFRALIGLHDDLVGESAPLKVALCVAPPGPSGDRRFDAAIAAVVDHHLSTSRLPVPTWVRDPPRTLDVPWVVSQHTSPEAVPRAFRRHGVHLAPSELASV